MAQSTSSLSPISPTLIGSPLRRSRHHRKIGEPALVLVMAPQRRQREIGERGVGNYDAKGEQQEALQPRMAVMRR
jgi:hypothetical protein